MSQRDKKRHTTLLLALAVGMFGFAFALVPLYDVFCEITGLNGKTSGQAELLAEIDRTAAQEDREVKIEFLASVARGMSWEFRPMDKEIIVRPGTMNKTTFFVRNRSNKTVIGQAVPSVSPGQAAQYLKKIECFCFEQQKLMAGAEMEMGVTFYVDAELPAHINELTLSYTMFLVSDLVGSNEHEHLSSHNVR
ncbi:MAG: cytochrome c oxidase assembly protein [Proteobacteria bacterium]|nr:cytochrome c oxidase assembly protein [Pseudomonadota bacterium]